LPPVPRDRRHGLRGIRLRGIRRGLRLDWFRVRVLLSAAATALLVLGLRGAHGPGPEIRGAPPWPAPASVAAGVRAAGLPLLAAPGEVVRFAVHLNVIVDGQPVTVPSGIGVDAPARRTSPLYTADTSGIVHVTANSDQSVFTLGQFFAEWQVPLSRSRLGGLRAAPSAPVAVYLDGSAVAGAPGSVLLTPHLQIAVTYRPGRAPVPSDFAFPAGT
jgi:hypothetical protein